MVPKTGCYRSMSFGDRSFSFGLLRSHPIKGLTTICAVTTRTQYALLRLNSGELLESVTEATANPCCSQE